MSGRAELDPWHPTAKAWAMRCVKLAQHGRAALRSDPDDPGPQRFFVVHGCDVQMLADADALDALIDRLDSLARSRATAE